METFLNLAWLILSVAMLAAWVMGRYSPNRHRASDWRLQFVSLALLLLILLPVVSLTDDLQAWTTPAETEHGLRRADSAPETIFPALIPPLWSHVILTSLVPNISASDFNQVRHFGEPQMGVSHPLENRPPPRSMAS